MTIFYSQQEVKRKILLFNTNSYATDVEEDDVDECHRNDLLPNDVAGMLEVLKHNNDQCEAAFDIPAVQSEENK